jgi:hypothetical protein
LCITHAENALHKDGFTKLRTCCLCTGLVCGGCVFCFHPSSYMGSSTGSLISTSPTFLIALIHSTFPVHQPYSRPLWLNPPLLFSDNSTFVSPPPSSARLVSSLVSLPSHINAGCPRHLEILEIPGKVLEEKRGPGSPGKNNYYFTFFILLVFS